MADRNPDRPRRAPAWLRAGVRAALIASAPVPLTVLAIFLVAPLQVVYPLALLPLLLAGPLAVRGLPARAALASALLAGGLAGAIASVSLAIGSSLPGGGVWTLTGPAAAPPMPPLPRPALPLPLTWAQQNVLLLEPLVALAGALLALGWRRVGPVVGPLTDRGLPRSLGARLALTLGGLSAMTLLVGGVAFGALEEMHFRGHRLQLLADWQAHLDEVAAGLEQARQAARLAQPLGDAPERVDAAIAHLASATPHRSIAVPRPEMLVVLDGYLPLLEAVRSAHARLRASPTDVVAAEDALLALDALRRQVTQDESVYLNTSDTEHHGRLIAVMLGVALAGLLGLWLNQQTVAAVSSPIRTLGGHLQAIAQGDFSRRVPLDGAVEIRQLAAAVNAMAADLDRLYQMERTARASAEAMASREREVAAAKEFWTNTVIHDLKSPLSVVVGYAEMLASGRLGAVTPTQQSAIKEMSRSARELLDLAGDINDSFRLEADAVALRQEALAPAQVLAAAASESVRPESRPPRVETPADLPRVVADPRLVQRVLLNLLGNAYKHAGPAANVVLRAEALPEQPAMVTFAVEDDGPGIPEHQRERVFERFVQGDGASTGPGSGLGLAFCRLVVERHGGRIWVEPTPQGSGACVRFTLPAAHSAVPAAPEALAVA